MAHKKGVGSSKNGRESASKRLAWRSVSLRLRLRSLDVKLHWN